RRAASQALAAVRIDAAAGQLLHRLGAAAEQDRQALGMALSGVLARSHDASLVARVKQTLVSTRETERDALIEALGRMHVAAAGRLLAQLAKRPQRDDRRKVAEALAGHPAEVQVLIDLLRDADPGVRANAAWSLGKQRAGAALPALSKAAHDIEVTVAGNAVVALGQVAANDPQRNDANRVLCRALDDYRPYVRAGALTGLRQLHRGCKPQLVLRLARHDDHWRVRLAAADLLHQLASAAPPSQRRPYALALRHCVQEERHAAVAARCETPLQVPSAQEDVVVFVIPTAQTSTQPRAPFALVLADGRMRLGVADRRGIVFEANAPAGSLSLAVPAALAR
ncbi:MAG TPA: hypothetical protein ENK23_08340, partial [Sorangium sp.]|nr:hypothetical protein [Sorangium sp.]